MPVPSPPRRSAARAWRGWLLVALLVAAGSVGTGVVGAAERSARSQEAEPASGSPASAAADLRLGGQLYALQCAVCHGTDGAGVGGSGRTAGPALQDVDVAYLDLTLRTGRMPLALKELGIAGEALDEAERVALVAWLQREHDLPGAVPEVGEGAIGRGHALYARFCAACHGSTGYGGVSAGGTLVRPVRDADAVAVAEAIRVGPFRMPEFDSDLLDDDDVADIAAYVTQMASEPSTPLGLDELDRVQMGALVLVLAAGMLGVVLLVARPVRAPDDAGEQPDESPSDAAGPGDAAGRREAP